MGDDAGSVGSSGIANDGVTEPARPDAEGCADDLRVVADVERAATLPGIVVLLLSVDYSEAKSIADCGTDQRSGGLGGKQTAQNGWLIADKGSRRT